MTVATKYADRVKEPESYDMTHAAFDTLKLNQNQWIEVVEQIKQIGNAPAAAPTRRQHARAQALGLLQIVIEVSHPGGTRFRLVARSHDLNPNGLGFIHAHYLHPSSRCRCWMLHATEGLRQINGSIRWCRHVGGVIHMSGVELDEMIRVSDYLPGAAEEAEVACGV